MHKLHYFVRWDKMWNNPSRIDINIYSNYAMYLQDLSGFYVVLAGSHANRHPTTAITLCEPDTASCHAIGEKCHIVTVKSFVHHGQDGFPYFLIGVPLHTALNWRLLAFGWYQIAEGVPCGNCWRYQFCIGYKYINIYTVYKVLGIKYCLAVELTRLCFSLGPRDSTPPCRTSSLLSRLHPRLDKVEQESQWKIPKNTHTISHQVYHPSASCTSCALLVAKRWCILRSRVSPGPCHIGIQLPWCACLHQVLQSHLLGQLSCPQSLAKQKRWSLLAS